MNNALEVLAAMSHWWDTTRLQRQRTAAEAMNIGIAFLYTNAYPEYQRMQRDASRSAHIRAMFTVWKAVCANMERSKTEFYKEGTQEVVGVRYAYPFYDPRVDVVRLFPTYIETRLPDLFIQLIAQNVFLGVRFTDEDRARHEQLRRTFTRPPPVQTKGRPLPPPPQFLKGRR